MVGLKTFSIFIPPVLWKVCGKSARELRTKKTTTKLANLHAVERNWSPPTTPEWQYSISVPLFIRLSTGLFENFLFVLISSVGLQRRDEFIMLVLYISWQSHPTYAQLKVSKSMFNFICQISFISMIYFLLNQ